MGLIVLPATISDIKEVYDVYFASFDGQLINQVLFPGGITEEFRKTHTEHTLQWWHTSTMQHTFKCVDTDTGKIVGMAIWDIYWREKTEAERQKPWIGWLEGKERERAEGFVVPFWEQRERWLGGRRHVYCHVIGVHPDHQRRGIGSLLMRWGMDVAENLGVPVYLESTMEGYPMYKRLEFEKLSAGVLLKPAVTYLESDIEAPLMAKMPAAARGMTFEAWADKGYPPFA